MDKDDALLNQWSWGLLVDDLSSGRRALIQLRGRPRMRVTLIRGLIVDVENEFAKCHRGA